MGLYDDLPSARAKANENVPASERAVGAADARVGEDARAKRPRDEDVPAARSTDASSADAPTASEALRRIAPHLLRPDKFAKAAGVLRKVLVSDSCGRSEAKALYACLENAMTPTPKRALEAAHRIEYEDLFEVVAAFAPVVFNAKQKMKVEAWQTYARRANALHTDDSFQFSKAVKAINERVEALSHYEAIDDNDEDAEVEVPPAPEGASEEEAQAMAEAFVAAAKAERAAEIEARKVDEEKRQALTDCLEVAASLYHKPWAQTAIDMMSTFFHERRDKFSPSCQEQIVRIWDDLRKRKNARKAGGDVDSTMTSYERDAARAAGSSVSARGAVGSERLADGRGEACAKMLG